MIKMFLPELMIAMSSRSDMKIALAFVDLEIAIYSTCVFILHTPSYSRHDPLFKSTVNVASEGKLL